MTLAPIEVTLPNVSVPTGVLFAQLQQEREDVVRGLYEIELHNGTGGEVDIARASISWDGFNTSPPNTGGTKIATQAIISLPVAFNGAHCSGDGSAASMPSTDTATVSVTYDDGTTAVVPVADVAGILAKLYVADCERQQIEKLVKVSLIDFQDVTVNGLPRIEATLHFERAAATGVVRLIDTKGSVIFTLAPLNTPSSPMLTLAPGQQSADLAVSINEAKCEDHAFAETKQPFLFVLTLDPGDGIEHGYNISPDVAVQPHLFDTAINACKIKNGTITSFPTA